MDRKDKNIATWFKKAGVVEVLEGAGEGDWIVRKGADALEEGTPVDVPKAMEEELLKKFKEAKSK